MFTSDFTIRVGITPTFLYFDLYLNTAYAAHYVYFAKNIKPYRDEQQSNNSVNNFVCYYELKINNIQLRILQLEGGAIFVEPLH